MPVAPGIARKRSSSQMEVEFVELARQIWAAVASAGQVRSWRVAAEARSLKWLNVHRCRAMSRREGGRCRTARRKLLKTMMPRTDDAMARVRAPLPCSLRGNAPPHRTTDTEPAAGATDRLLDDVVSADGALRHGTAIGEVASPSWSRG